MAYKTQVELLAIEQPVLDKSRLFLRLVEILRLLEKGSAYVFLRIGHGGLYLCSATCTSGRGESSESEVWRCGSYEYFCQPLASPSPSPSPSQPSVRDSKRLRAIGQ